MAKRDERSSTLGATTPPSSNEKLACWLWLAGILALLIALPVTASWLEALSHRGWRDNAVQGLVLIILLVAIIRKRKQPLPALKPNVPGPILLATVGIILLVAALLSIKALLWGGWLLLLAALGLTLFGWRFTRKSLPLIAFAFFLLPQMPLDVQNTLSQPLQMISTQLTVWLAGLFIPISAQGNIFTINGNAFEVTAPCSGLNSWLGFLFAGLLWLLFERGTPRRLLMVLLLAPALAVTTNVLRLFITALVAYHASPDAAMAVHSNLEFLLFPLGLATLWWLLRVQTKPEKEDAPSCHSTTPPCHSCEGRNPLPSDAVQAKTTSTQSTYLAATCAWLLVLNIGIRALATPLQSETSALPIPAAIPGWQGENLPHTPEELAILAPARLISRVYRPMAMAMPPKFHKPEPSAAHGNQTVIWLNILETGAIGAMHNFQDSLVASGARPRNTATSLISTRKGLLRASLYEIDCQTRQRCLLMLWYQWPGGSAESRWHWYANILALRLSRKAPVWQLVELATPIPQAETPDSRSQSLGRLENFARQLYETSQP